MIQKTKDIESVINSFFIYAYIFSALTFLFFSNIFPLFFNNALGLVILTLMLCFLITKNSYVFIYITFPILFLESSLSPWSNSFVKYFHNGIFEYVSLYHLFSFMCLFQVLIVRPLIDKKIIINIYFIFFLLLLFVAFISVFKAFELDNIRLFQSLFFIQNFAVVIFLYNWFSEWSLSQLQKLLKMMFLLVIILLCINPLLDRHLITHAMYFFLAISFPLIIYTVRYLKANLPLKIIIISFILIYVLDQGTGQGSSATTIIIVSYSLFLSLLFIINKNLFNFLIICSLTIFITVQFCFIFFAFFPNILIQEFEFSYNERFQQGIGLIDEIRFKLFADRSAIWMGVFNHLNEHSFIENLINASGQKYNPIFHGTFSSAERAYVEWTAGAHQLILELTMNLGTFGATIYFIFLTKLCFTIRKISPSSNDSKYSSLLLISILSYFLFPSFVANFMLQSSSFLFWLSLALLMSFIKINFEQSNDKKNI